MRKRSLIVAMTACLALLGGCDRARDSFNRLRGDSHRLDQKHEEAIEWYSRIPTNRQDVAMLRSMAEAYQELDDYTNLAIVSRRIYERTGELADLEDLLQVHFDYEDDSNAVGVIRELIKTDKDEWHYKELLVEVTGSSAMSGQTAQTVAEIAASVPPSPSNLVRIAALWMNTGHQTNAIVLLEQALATNAHRHPWRLMLAAAQGGAGQHAAALSNLHLVERAWPGDARLLQLMGDTLTELGRADEAMQRYRALLRADQDNALAMNNLAYLLLKDDRTVIEGYELALSSVQRERSHYALDTLGYACYRKGEHAAALRYLTEAIEIMRTNSVVIEPELELHVGLVHGSQGNVAEATTWLRRALDAQPDLAETLRDEPCFPCVSRALGLDDESTAASAGTNTLHQDIHVEPVH